MKQYYFMVGKGSERMIKLTWSLQNFLSKYHPDLLVPLTFGKIELYTKEINNEYLDWLFSDEGKEYLQGGSKNKEN